MSTMMSVLRRQVLAVAASERKSLELRRDPLDWTPAAAPSGAAGPVLVLGPLPAQSEAFGAAHDDVVIADAESERLRESLLALLAARAAQPGCRRVRPDDLRVDLARLEREWDAAKPASLEDAERLFAGAQRRSAEDPAIRDETFAIVYCSDPRELVPSLERQADVLREAFRVLAKGGVARFVLDLADQPDAWPQRFTETGFLHELAAAGFYGIRIVHRSASPVAVRDGVELRTFVVEAHRGKEGPCMERLQAAIYTGPWKKVFDDDGHVFERGVRTAVCEKTYAIVTREPYRSQMLGIEPYVPVAPDDPTEFSCRPTVRTPSETKGLAPKSAAPGGPAAGENCC
ncbi:MAG: putative methyltransferase [Candidatus Eremiobacteraeota bacterium]|nr:putative methyltransferase [Candidatus Eremiobacteraeota bacterium]